MQQLVSDLYNRTLGGERNLSTVERAASVVFGLAAAAGGLRRGGGLGLLMGVGGAVLAMRGASGHCAMKSALLERGSAPTQSRGDSEMTHTAV